MRRRLSVQDRYLLGRIADGDVTWRNTSRGPSYRLWVNEDTTEVVTRRARRLIDDGLAHRHPAPWHQGRRGWVELTPAGQTALRRDEQASPIDTFDKETTSG